MCVSVCGAAYCGSEDLSAILEELTCRCTGGAIELAAKEVARTWPQARRGPVFAALPEAHALKSVHIGVVDDQWR